MIVIGIIYKIVLLILLIKYFILGRKTNFSTQNYLFIYFLITTINEWVSFIRNLINPDVKVGIQYNLYFIFCILFFGLFFNKCLFNLSKKISFLLTIASVVYVIFGTNFLEEDFDERIGITITLYYITNSLLWFHQKILFFDEHKIIDDPRFWITTALIMWSCFFIFRVTPMFYFAKEDGRFLQFLRIGQNIINIIMYLMFYKALINYKKNYNHGSYSR